jgi:glycosyltransferase involved in cell wall biosynthesis
MTRLSMVMITRDEAELVANCFSTWWDAVDEAVLCDTGSTDGTIETAEAFAAERGQSNKLRVSHFEWCDDFAAARNYAESLASGDWLAYIDLDELVVGDLASVRAKLNRVPRWCTGLLFEWSNDRPVDKGNGSLRRMFVVRAGVFTWIDRIDETRAPPRLRNLAMKVEADRCHWRHTRSVGRRSSAMRNLAISRRWLDEEPENLRARFMLVHKLVIDGQLDKAELLALQGLKGSVVPLGFYVLLAEIAARRGDQAQMLKWAEQGLSVTPLSGPDWPPESVIGLVQLMHTSDRLDGAIVAPHTEQVPTPLASSLLLLPDRDGSWR